MCGINGSVRTDGGLKISVSMVEQMNAALLHRGPDEGGTIETEFGAIGMRRLSIVDLEGGHQPMTTSDGRFSLVYNGELYDYDALRRDLQARGSVFRTRSDTEVLLHAWAELGTGALDRLNGMYAFAVVDRKDRSVVLVRDPIGIKPLYYHVTPSGNLIFSSELRGLLAHPDVPRRIDRRSLAMFLVDRYVADPWTLLDGVYQLPPGHLLRWRAGRVEVARYGGFKVEPEAREEASALAELQRLLSEVVPSQMVADVPVGIFLSGGVDSSTVAAFAAQSLRESGSKERLQTFSVGFSLPGYDESGRAREVASHLGSDHHELRIEDQRFDPGILDAIVDRVGQPLGDPSCIPTYALSRFARNQVKVALSGDGGDELFGGYDHMFWAARVRRVSERTPALARRLGAAVLARVAPMTSGALGEGVRRARKGLETALLDPSRQLRRLRCLWTEEDVSELLAEPADPRPELEGEEAIFSRLGPEDYAMEVLARTYLPGAILTKVDRMSMAASLEVRPPLLDRRVVEFACRLPLELKVRRRTGKYLLRRAAEGLLPIEVLHRRKQGFSIPLSRWLNGGFWDLLEESYAPGRPASLLFRRSALEQVIKEGRGAGEQNGRLSDHNAASRVWQLALLAVWIERNKVSL